MIGMMVSMRHPISMRLGLILFSCFVGCKCYSLTGQETDVECWTEAPFLEQCCTVPPDQGIKRGCWDYRFSFERCCGEEIWQLSDYNSWLEKPSNEAGREYVHCSEFVKRFDFMEPEGSPSWERFHECLRNRLNSVRTSYRMSTLAGQHYPTLITPGPHGLMFVTPANDFVVSRQLKSHGTFDPEELELYKKLLLPGSIVIDVGANVGSYAIPLAVHVGRDGLVVAVEPFQNIFQILTANSAINGLQNLRTKQLALGAKEERLKARGPALETWNNVGMARVFRPFEDKYAETFKYHASIEEQTVVVSTLDRLVESEELEQLTLLKVDVEGHLKAVLLGGAGTIRRFRPIIVAEDSGDDALDLLTNNYAYSCTQELPDHDVYVCKPRPKT